MAEAAELKVAHDSEKEVCPSSTSDSPGPVAATIKTEKSIDIKHELEALKSDTRLGQSRGPKRKYEKTTSPSTVPHYSLRDSTKRTRQSTATTTRRESEEKQPFKQVLPSCSGASAVPESAGTSRISGRDPIKSDHGELAFPSADCRIVLLGKTGNGKSSTGNSLLAEIDRFEVGHTFNSKTEKTERAKRRRLFLDVQLEVVDTPGICDTKISKEVTVKEIQKCMAEVFPGPNAVLIVLRLDVRFTDEEYNAMTMIVELFGKDVLKFAVLIFTHQDSRKASFQDVSEDNDNLKKLVKDVNGRYVMFNNTLLEQQKGQENNEQVKRLLTVIRDMLKDAPHGRPYFSNTFSDRLFTVGGNVASILGKDKDDDIVRKIVMTCGQCFQDDFEEKSQLEKKIEELENQKQEESEAANNLQIRLKEVNKKLKHSKQQNQTKKQEEIELLKEAADAADEKVKELERQLSIKKQILKEMDEKMVNSIEELKKVHEQTTRELTERIEEQEQKNKIKWGCIIA